MPKKKGGESRPKKPKTPKPPFTVLRDTREKLGWDFEADEESGCQGTVERGLKTGDYTLLGHEDKIAVERKRNTGEIAQNIFQARFEKELERLDAFEIPLVVCEFDGSDIEDFPARSGIPQSRWRYLRVRPELIWKKLAYFSCRYKARFILAGCGAQAFLTSLFKEYVKKHAPEPEDLNA